MRINGGTVSRSRVSSWCRTDPEKLTREIRTRQIHGDSRGIVFESDTIVIRGTKSPVCDYSQEDQSERIRQALPKKDVKSTKQSSMSWYNNGKKSSSSSKPKNGFFSKLLDEIDSRDRVGKAAEMVQKPWAAGVGDLPEEKRASVERSVKWMEERYDSNELPSVAPPASDANQFPMDLPKVEIVPSSVEQAVNSDVFMSLRDRLGNLLLFDLPPQVTGELRAMGRELEELSSTIKNF